MAITLSLYRPQFPPHSIQTVPIRRFSPGTGFQTGVVAACSSEPLNREHNRASACRLSYLWSVCGARLEKLIFRNNPDFDTDRVRIRRLCGISSTGMAFDHRKLVHCYVLICGLASLTKKGSGTESRNGSSGGLHFRYLTPFSRQP